MRIQICLPVLVTVVLFWAQPLRAQGLEQGGEPLVDIPEVILKALKVSGLQDMQLNTGVHIKNVGTREKPNYVEEPICEITVRIEPGAGKELEALGFIYLPIYSTAQTGLYQLNGPPGQPCPPPPAVEGWEFGKKEGLTYPAYTRAEKQDFTLLLGLGAGVLILVGIILLFGSMISRVLGLRASPI